MLTNYFKIAWRNISRHKLFSFINLFGLASGMTVCMMALMQIKGAYDYDSFHPDSNCSYRIITDLQRSNGDHFLCASSPLPLSDYLKRNYSFIDNATTVHFAWGEMEANRKKLSAKAAYVDSGFYQIFGFPIQSGAPALQPHTALITAEAAQKFFGKTNPVGNIASIGKAQFMITGIVGKPPFPSHLRFDFLLPASDIAATETALSQNDWADEAAAYTYVQVKKGTSEETLHKALQNTTAQVNQLLPRSAGKRFQFDAQALDDISPSTQTLYNLTDEPILPNLIAFALIGFCILLLSFFNYINLTLARSFDRAREVGIRKVAGARRHQLLFQFLSESVLFALFAFGLALLQLHFIHSLSVVQNLIGDVKQDSTLWFYFILFTLFTGLLAGWIPARIFSRFQPVKVLKGKWDTKLFGSIGLRKTLLVIQFAVSLIAIVSLLVFYRQSAYMANADYGFAREGIINIKLPQQGYQKAASAFASVAGVERIAGISEPFGFFGGDTRFIKKEKGGDSLSAASYSVTPSLLQTLNLRLLSGENFTPGITNEVVLNEEACRILQFKTPEAATGDFIWVNDSTQYRVAGVVKDFHYASFKRSIQPLLLINQPDEATTMQLKVSKGAEANIFSTLQKTWKQLYPQQPFEALWFDRELHDQHLHKDDLLFTGMLTLMAISIACLGLLGMVIYTAQNRAKEVAIRKVMGANVAQLIIIVAKEFMTLLLIALCIGLPVGFLAGNQFLQQYAYRIPVGVGILGSSALLLLVLGVCTIGWQTFRTAAANPVKSLRTE